MSEDLPDDGVGTVLSRLRELGSDLTKPMVFEFFVAAANKEDLERFAGALDNTRFAVRIERDDVDDDAFEDEGELWTCYCETTLIPSHANVSAIQDELDALAEDMGVAYDGFETSGNHRRPN